MLQHIGKGTDDSSSLSATPFSYPKHVRANAHGALGIRTPNLRLAKTMLYQIELRPHTIACL